MGLDPIKISRSGSENPVCLMKQRICSKMILNNIYKNENITLISIHWRSQKIRSDTVFISIHWNLEVLKIKMKELMKSLIHWRY